MKNTIRKLLIFMALIFIWGSLNGNGCTKVMVYGKNYDTFPYKSYYQTDKATVLEAVKKTLEVQKFAIQNADAERGRVTTGWRPVESDSHYLKLFERKDFGATDGAYYQLVVDLMEENSKVKVLVSTTVKTIVGKLQSNGIIEKRILAQLEDAMRSPQIEMTNVSVERK